MQKSDIKKFEGYWLVTIDSTDQAREWNRIYYFEKCSKQERLNMTCKGHFGWAEFDDIYLNLYDRNYLTYGILEEIDKVSGTGKLLLSSIEYDFMLSNKGRLLQLYSLGSGELVMEMAKVPKSEVR